MDVLLFPKLYTLLAFNQCIVVLWCHALYLLNAPCTVSLAETVCFVASVCIRQMCKHAKKYRHNRILFFVDERLYVELLFYHEVIASKVGFGSLSPTILFYKGVKILNHFMKLLKL